MSLYDIWRFQIGFAVVLAAEGIGAAALGAVGVWPVSAAATLALVGIASALLVFPRYSAPERPAP